MAIFHPSLFATQLSEGIYLYHLVVTIAVVWLVIFLAMDVRLILVGKRVTDHKTGT